MALKQRTLDSDLGSSAGTLDPLTREYSTILPPDISAKPQTPRPGLEQPLSPSALSPS
eukprot:CAMPEP_0184295410 /NCGR_PEP_ID=MMETSP1049-20130417/6251_1 /TAXON_ID=77928 /ORGANISM="Proteomonas sulcata, Strain CCMP704" /LENGTH=57 /DNA_ID=CAMNT_0026603889 /DNA_START=766 /DNA_END=936 /DNA_ORIENTATION=+